MHADCMLIASLISSTCSYLGRVCGARCAMRPIWRADCMLIASLIRCVALVALCVQFGGVVRRLPALTDQGACDRGARARRDRSDEGRHQLPGPTRDGAAKAQARPVTWPLAACTPRPLWECLSHVPFSRAFLTCLSHVPFSRAFLTVAPPPSFGPQAVCGG